MLEGQLALDYLQYYHIAVLINMIKLFHVASVLQLVCWQHLSCLDVTKGFRYTKTVHSYYVWMAETAMHNMAD